MKKLYEIKWCFFVVGLIAFSPITQAQSLSPFGSGVHVPAQKITITNPSPITEAVPCFVPALASHWSAIGVLPSENVKLFTIDKVDGEDALRLFTGAFEPGKTLVNGILPTGQSGKEWSSKGITYISFSCQSTKALVTLRLQLTAAGKTTGAPAAFSVTPGSWQRIYIPVMRFGKKNLARAEGIAFGVVTTDGDSDVLISKVTVGNTIYTKDSWTADCLSIGLSGDWHFMPDIHNEGINKKWDTEDFNDSSWQILKTGASWEKQGVPTFSGYGWYRQKFVVPKEYDGTPITFTLAKFTGDDDAYVNGARIGGIKGEYRYENLALRTYTAPPSIIHYGATNTIALRIWGGNLGFQIRDSGLVAGVYTAELDPYGVRMQEPGGSEQAPSLFDLSSAQRGKPFEIVFRFPGELLKSGSGKLHYNLTDFYNNSIGTGVVPVTLSKEGVALGVVSIDAPTSQAIYLCGRIKTDAVLCDAADKPIYCDTDEYGHELDHLDFAQRDALSLPPLAETEEDTPYGRLKLIDEVDCSQPLNQEQHPYLQSGFDRGQNSSTPGSPVHVVVHEIMGKKARESDNGWFAYRIGRGKLTPHTNYLVRIEYPEDKPRYCPVLIEAGHNYMCIGWKNGLTPSDPYDNWPLSHQWQWYDAIVSLDDYTLGSGSVTSAPSKNGFWVYLINKIVPHGYFSLYQGGPAVSRIKLYAIDPDKNAPLIHFPDSLPRRVFTVDWEHQPDNNPDDLVRYAKLMGYNAVSPVIIKWGFDNYSDPLNGYNTVNVDDCGYWARDMYENDLASHAKSAPPVPDEDSIHIRYLAATKHYGLDYIPRIEYGGSYDLPVNARAIASNGKLAKPNRYAQWSADLLQSATYDDMAKLIDHLIKPYAQDNPQLTGILWRIRSDRMQISYSHADLDLFTKETGTNIPGKTDVERSKWADGQGKEAYDNWWHKKREEFHVKIRDLLKSYRSDMTLYYYNWDEDKWSLILPALQNWSFLSKVLAAPPGTGTSVYEKEREERSKLTSNDYVQVIHSGNFGKIAKGVNRADYALRPDLYKDVTGIELFAPVSELFYANDPVYLNYFQTGDGLAVSNPVPYDEIGYKTINRRFECNMMTPAGSAFSMALEVLACFHGDPRTLTYTPYTFGRGFADAHRRFAQAYLALPAIKGTVVEGTDPDLKVRLYKTDHGTYVGVVYKGYTARKLTISLPGPWQVNATITNLVTNAPVPATPSGNQLQFDLSSGPMELNAFLIQ